MSVYLGNNKVAVSYKTSGNLYEDQRTIYSNDIYTPWVRPQGWPDLDSLNLEMSGEDSFIYMTYRTGHIDDVFSCGWTIISGQSITIEEGTISNGQFVGTTLQTATANGSFTKWFTSDNGYSDGTVVLKVSGRFSRFYLMDVTRDSSVSGTIKYYMQPLLERIWYVPNMTAFTTSYSAHGNSAYTLQRDKINNGDGSALTNMYYAWWNCYDLRSLDISGLKTQNVTTMSCTFEYCRKLEYLDVAHFNTAKVTNMNYMFDACYRIRQLDLRTWNTQKLTGTGFYYAFRSCYALEEILGLENIYTNNLTSLVAVFSGCYSIKDLSSIKNWNISKVTSLASLFNGCLEIKKIDLSKWDVSKVTNISSLFNGCRSLQYINFPQVQTDTLSGSQASVFYNCWALQEIDLTWIKSLTSAVTSIGYMFSCCKSLIEINIPEEWNISGCIVNEGCYRIFSDCNNLQKITGISNWDMSGYNYSLAYSFQYCYCLKELNIKNWCPHPTSMYYAFASCYSLQEIDLTGWHWENMTGTALGATFDNCHSLKEIKGIEHMGDSGNITSFSATFNGCYSLQSIPNISSWDPAKVTSCASMFSSCHQLKSLTISNWTLTKCTNIAGMFRYCYNMEELELTNWSLPALTTVPDYIFCEMYCLKKCSGLPIPLNHRYQYDYSLPEDQWARIFTQLPTVSGKTLYMTTANINRLTAATKAIATNKGWTLAN